MIKCFDGKLQGVSRQVGSDWFDPPLLISKTVEADLQSDSATSGQDQERRADGRPDVSVACSGGGSRYGGSWSHGVTQDQSSGSADIWKLCPSVEPGTGDSSSFL